MKQRVFTVLRGTLIVGAIALATLATGQENPSPGRKPFAGPRTSATRHSLLDQWKGARHAKVAATSFLAPAPQATGGTPIVGRASMVINSSNSIAYTRQYLGIENNCDVNIGIPGDWMASTAYLAGDHVRRFGTNYIASVAGTSGVTGPSCGSGVGTPSVDGTVTWLCEGNSWVANTTYTAGMVTRPTSSFGFMFQAQNTGMTGATQPLWPTTFGATVVDNGVTWTAIANPQGTFRGCNPMQIAVRASGGGETVIVSEGDALPAGPQVFGWSEHIDMNSSGVVAFKSALSGVLEDSDEQGTAIVTAGPGAGTLTAVMKSGDTVGGRFLCGFTSMVALNDAGQVLGDSYGPFGIKWQPSTNYTLGERRIPATPNGLEYFALNSGTSGSVEPAWPTNVNATVVDGAVTWRTGLAAGCDTDDDALIRYTPGFGNELLVAKGSVVGGSTVTIFGCTTCVDSYYDQTDGRINENGNVPVVLSLADGTEGVYLFTGPGSSFEIARTGGSNPYTSVSPRATLNDNDQVAFIAIVGGVESLYVYTPPAVLLRDRGPRTEAAPPDTTVVVSVGDDIGTRTTATPSGVTVTAIGNYVDINNNGNVVFQVDLSSGEEGYYFWDAGTGDLQEIHREVDNDELAPEMLTINDSDIVAYVTGSQGYDIDASEDPQFGGAYFWQAGVSTPAIEVGDVIGGDTVTGLFAQHHSFARRQFSSTSCLALAYAVNGDDIWMDCSAGDPGCYVESPLIFTACAAAAAGPTLTTVASSSVPVGGSVSDTATLAGGVNPTGTITFDLYGPNDATCTGAVAFTSNVNVTGNGSYPSAPFTTTAAGTYRWIASYSGDVNNAAVATSCGDPLETVIVTQATPTLSTTATATATVGGTISDSATIASGFNPTGTITFKLFGPADSTCAGTPVFMSSVNATGNGTYNSGNVTPTAPGTYRWVVLYSGDTNNAATSGACNDPNETSVVSPASPTLTTNATATAAVGTAISDTATLSGSYNATGTITFNLYDPTSPICDAAFIATSTVPVSGDGVYTSAPFTPTTPGTYRWIASYSGDANNDAVGGVCNDANESSVVTKASPTLTTTASPGVVLGGSVTDSATLASGYNPTGSITFNLYGPGDATCSAAAVFTSTVPVAGNGNYGSASFTPASPGTYRWIATYTGDGNNNIAANACGDPNETVVVSSPSLATPTLTTIASPDVAIGGGISDSATLSGGNAPGGTITFTVYGPDSATCSLAAFTSTVPVTGNGTYNSGTFFPTLAGTYRFVANYSGDANNNPVNTACNDPNEDVVVSPSGPVLVTTASPGVPVGGAISDTATLSGGFNPAGTITFNLYGPNDAACSAASIFTSTVPVTGNGNYASGPFTATAPGTYRWTATYSGDANNGTATSPCNAPNESVIVTSAAPTLTTTASPSVPLGGSVSDTATLAGGFNPGGTITFNLFGPDNATCSGAPVFTSTTNVTGNGSYASASFTPVAAGTYRWVATYSGDANNTGSANPCGDPAETVVVTPPSGTASPTLVTNASPSVVVGGTIRDTGVLSGGNAPTGTIVFRAYGPIDTLCSGSPVFSASVFVNGNGTYHSPFFRPASAGIYNFTATYGGDANNNPAVSPCGAPNESVRVTQARPTLTAAASPNVQLGGTISNTAVLSGGYRPQGSIVFTVFGPNNASCTGLPLFTSSTPVDGNGTYESADFLPTETGTYRFVVRYRGDLNNQEVVVPCGAANSIVEVTCAAAGAPIVSIVGEASTNYPYQLHWTAVPGALTYEVQESTTEDFFAATTRLVDGTLAEFRHPASTPTAWFYRVRAVNVCDQAFGPFSDTGRVVVVPLPPPDRPDINVNVPAGSTEIIVQQIHIPGVPGQTFTFTAEVDQPWLSVTPKSGIFTPAGITFDIAADPSLLPNGTHTGTLIVTLTTIDEAAGRAVRAEGVTTVSATVSVNLVTPVTNLPATTPQANSILIPSLGHLQGASARWQSDIRVLNSTTANQTWQVIFTPASEYGSGAVKTTLVTATPGQTIALDDVVRNWFGLGSLDDRTSGFLEIRPLTLSVPKAIASSRTYSLTPGSKGTLGQFIPALSFNDFIGSVSSSPSLRPPVLSMQQIAQSDAFRTNVGLLEASGKPASALLSVFNTSGTKLLALPVDLGAGEQKQLNSLLAQHGIALDDGRIEVQLTSGEGKVTAFASVIDNRSGVPLLVSGVPLGAEQSTRYVLPGVADLNTASARWRTDMRVFNPDSVERNATLVFHPQNNGGTPVTREITLGPGAIRTLDDVVRSLFGQSDIGGAVHVTTAESSSLVVTGRTYNVTATGTLGQFIPAVTPAQAVGRGERLLQILQAEDSVRYRTNLGLAEVTGRPATVEVTVILPDAKITPTVRFDLQPNEFRQFRVLSDFGLANAYNARISVRVVEGDGRVTAYGSVIDLTTESPTFIPAQ